MKLQSFTRPSSQALVGPQDTSSAAAFGAQIGAAISGVGEQVSILGNVVAEQDKARRKFASLQNFSKFQTSVQTTMLDLKRNSDPALANYSEIATATYKNMEKDFLEKGVDPEFYDEFATRTTEFGSNVAMDSLAFQYESTDKWFRQGIDDAAQKGRIALSQNGTPENFDMQMANVASLVASSGLTPAEQVSTLRNSQKSLSAVLYKQQMTQEELDRSVRDPGTARAAALIGNFAGGTEAEQEMLAKEGEQIAVGALGDVDLWSAMPDHARAAVASLASDLGELPATVKQAIESGDLKNVSEAIRNLGGERRTQEADLILDPGAQIDDDPRYSQLPYEDRLVIRQDAKQAASAIATQQAKADKAQNDSLVNSLMVGLYDGTAGLADIDTLREMNVLTDIEDIQKAHTIYDKRNADIELSDRGIQMLRNNVEFDPTSTDDKNSLNAIVGQEGIKALQNHDSQYAANFLVPLVRQSRDIPTEAAGALIGMMRSNNQEDALWALDLLSQLQQASPRAYNNRIHDDDASAVQLYQTRKDLYPPDQLLSLINGGLTQQERQANKVLREDAQLVLKDNTLNLAGDLINQFDDQFGWTQGGPTASQIPWAAKGLQADFAAVFEDQYTLYGEPTAAKKATIEILKRSWGPTSVGTDNKLMKYPPELAGYKPVAGNYDWMERQLRSEIVFPTVDAARANEGGIPLISPDEGFELLTDAQTESEVDAFKRGGPPASYLLVRIKDGQPSIVMDPLGKPIRQYFDISEEERAQDAAWRADNAQSVAQEDLMRQLRLSIDHSLGTGIPIPPDSIGGKMNGIMQPGDGKVTIGGGF